MQKYKYFKILIYLKKIIYLLELISIKCQINIYYFKIYNIILILKLLLSKF